MGKCGWESVRHGVILVDVDYLLMSSRIQVIGPVPPKISLTHSRTMTKLAPRKGYRS